jgi:hypothetical protein
LSYDLKKIKRMTQFPTEDSREKKGIEHPLFQLALEGNLFKQSSRPVFVKSLLITCYSITDSSPPHLFV